MKKILFSFLKMNTAGTEKSLLEILRRLGDRYEIHLAVAIPGGTGEKIFSENVHIHHIKGFSRNVALIMEPKKEIPRRLLTLRWRSGIPAAYHYLRSVMNGSLAEYAAWLLREDRAGGRNANPALDGEFDLSVDFTGPPGEYLEYYATNHIKAKRYASFIHFDLDWVSLRQKTSEMVYDKCDGVFCVSELALDQFRERFPKYAHKGHVLHNFTDNKLIIEKAQESNSGYAPVEGALNIVSVGRLTYHKGVEYALYALKALADDGVDAHWHFVGGVVEYGSGKNPYLLLAEQLGVADRAHFTSAEVKNPYPYILGADVYVQLSRSEGYGIAMAEACILGTPIVATNSGAAQSLLDRPNGILLPALKKTTRPEDVAPSIAAAIRRAATLPRQAPSLTPLTPLTELQPFLDLL